MKRTLTINHAGTGDFALLQAAIDSIPENGSGETVLVIEAGVYREKLCINKPNLRLCGKGEVRLVYDDYALKPGAGGSPMGTFASASTYITGDNIRAENIIFENRAGKSSEAGQAVALYVDADKVSFVDCSFLGAQDTLYLGRPKEETRNSSGRNYFERCRIAGDIDFIFGSATAYFEECAIISLNQGREINGYITAAATPADKETGFVFHRCRLLSDAAADSVYLGRPWRDYARTVFLDCWMGGHIRREGWHDWDKSSAGTTVFYGEYGSAGPGAHPEARAAWTRLLKQADTAGFTLEACFGADLSWTL
ncbi:pectinesterase family protein [Paenibacillus sp. S150]|uniref:pectinesterase family protein n=1 Tax=Paenibacillus sp. S150 TaxID=2749826 RepID=UPI001C571FB3|nr:pectinesterase family protein [Paenibacillus sp. S150]MBW4081349.1 pectin methylesterase [Paenibacillus sp. S150]